MNSIVILLVIYGIYGILLFRTFCYNFYFYAKNLLKWKVDRQ